MASFMFLCLISGTPLLPVVWRTTQGALAILQPLCGHRTLVSPVICVSTIDQFAGTAL